jgi:hypothetical protein
VTAQQIDVESCRNAASSSILIKSNGKGEGRKLKEKQGKKESWERMVRHLYTIPNSRDLEDEANNKTCFYFF